MKNIIKKTANLLTIFRIFLVFCMLPFLYLKLLKHEIEIFKNYFNIIFIVASITDYLDGFIARKFFQTTVFGKFFDPIADKLLVIISSFYLLILCQNNHLLHQDNDKIVNYVVSFLIVTIIRDFIVMGIRLLAFEKKHIISSSFGGKLKTFLNFVSIIIMLLSAQLERFFSQLFPEYNLKMYFIINFILILNIFIIVISGIDYILKNLKLIYF
ncbi:CDP-diacylglycerol--glycerol-3-phosphate 3-phosphatidyltransferase [Candidatus Phytoplasma citri]|uniref:CDP-diacylglycerol--glycerol-3-phosphate 3-phosphatidyltransferase n=1 Tax=Candidatus Phytoplasma citri TaxID=180978 RepID=A0A1S9M0G0_9MOLU|nr:CDP-diacylglycerol--glycerol-3-phosphate 3-phosphatidyltransferase [Candidatus Phytoplasma aurantifolia]MDO8060191.1 CDP-diacylglycerol--glycerol-3-phosphate 3-phosphatidyltransferase [Candidatus Phytoplasma aurantifolia]MDO8079024.1 CDP-diacylglycerol--glycerol-3-phosphate 3-phosphatidyltransferase [Candidatus Phytoplasma aurantifolia]OOP58573.1 CDP-diacylglycerol--glycerol-3-phosphate 3-phosphatidyltransferase [Candidatus Phytoplasma aurantifolia]